MMHILKSVFNWKYTFYYYKVEEIKYWRKYKHFMFVLKCRAGIKLSTTEKRC